jgi:hypothetical protein
MKVETIIELPNNPESKVIAKGFLILNSAWVTEGDKGGCLKDVNTGRIHKILDVMIIELQVLKPLRHRLDAATLASINGKGGVLSNFEMKSFACVKVSDQHLLKTGDKLSLMLSRNTCL